MWAQHWNNIEYKVKPYPKQTSPDTTAKMKELVSCSIDISRL